MTWPAGDAWAETAHLTLEAEGRLYRRGYFDPAADDEWIPARELGRIDGYHEVPDDLAGELVRLLDLWSDAPSRAELERERGEEYRAGLGRLLGMRD